MRCQNKVAVVTGATGSVLGRSIALTLAREGSQVVVNYRSHTDAANAVVAAIEGMGRAAVAVQADVYTAAGCRRLVDAARAAYGRVDICVIGPGGGFHGEPVDHLAVDAALEDLQHEVAPVYHLLPLVLPGMMERQWGRIIGITMNRDKPSPAYAYNTAKAARGHALLHAHERAWSRGVTVNLIAPGPVAPIASLEAAVALAGGSAAWAERPNVSPQDIAEGVAFLCSEAGRFVTGTELVYDFRR